MAVEYNNKSQIGTGEGPQKEIVPEAPSIPVIPEAQLRAEGDAYLLELINQIINRPSGAVLSDSNIQSLYSVAVNAASIDHGVTLGFNAGAGSSGNTVCDFIGLQAGQNVTGSHGVGGFGLESGKNSYNNHTCTFLGTKAGDTYNGDGTDIARTSSGSVDAIAIGHKASTAGHSNCISIGHKSVNTKDYQLSISDEVIYLRIGTLEYTLPTTHAAGTLHNDGTGILTWQ